MKRFPFGHDVVILGSLLSACHVHGHVVMGERLARQLLKLQPVTTSPYVLLSNLYASDDIWDGVTEARKMLKTVREKCFVKCITKPGSSLSGSEGSCISRCVDRYIEATGIISKSLFKSSSH
ncbi:Pentatricopeptide repeat superfamily protein [Tripterygium wilfordii]|uniref:Mitochondrial import inner membrane translocase subunit n=1 Tax=Tripterygium wilfordii TaxID=458696 RepID=A0A7J7CLW6_TRIWF|nr:Pentatricopeptide repeat superfamily protein [Tripterygium wilfordii]